MQKQLDIELIQELVDKRVCVSKAEARRLLLSMSEEKIRARLDRVKIVKT